MVSWVFKNDVVINRPRVLEEFAKSIAAVILYLIYQYISQTRIDQQNKKTAGLIANTISNYILGRSQDIKDLYSIAEKIKKECTGGSGKSVKNMRLCSKLEEDFNEKLHVVYPSIKTSLSLAENASPQVQLHIAQLLIILRESDELIDVYVNNSNSYFPPSLVANKLVNLLNGLQKFLDNLGTT